METQVLQKLAIPRLNNGRKSNRLKKITVLLIFRCNIPKKMFVFFIIKSHLSNSQQTIESYEKKDNYAPACTDQR